jgi:hypothetical protein
MNKHKIIIIGLGIGILLFFFGIGIYFLLGPSTEGFRLPQQISSLIKLSGMGLITISIIVGSLYDEKIDKDSKSIMLIFGIILLLLNIFIMSSTRFY